MRNLKKAFGLSFLAALCLTAFMASSAQALLINGGEFLTSEGTFKQLKVESETATGKEVVPGSGEFLILGLDLILTCENVKVESGIIKWLGHGDAELLFEECQFFDHSEGSAGCEPFHITVDALALVFLHGNVSGETHHPYILFEPAGGGTVFASVVPEGCLVPPADIEGNVVAEVLDDPLGHVEKPIIAVNAGTLELFPDHGLFYGENEGHLDVEAELWLTGALEGKDWGVS